MIIKAVAGPHEGTEFKGWPGARVGRSRTELVLNDSKVSSIHAQFELDPKGRLVLVDKGSANGLQISGGNVQRVAMLRGVVFQLGRSSFKVLEIRPDEEPPSSEELRAQNRPIKWNDVLIEDLPLIVDPSLKTPTELEVLRPALRLSFVAGPQLDHEILLGYGPRKFGTDVLDIELYELASPPLAFEIFPHPEGAEFRTDHPKLVLLNCQQHQSAVLKDGDQIQIGSTLIKVSYAL